MRHGREVEGAITALLALEIAVKGPTWPSQADFLRLRSLVGKSKLTAFETVELGVLRGRIRACQKGEAHLWGYHCANLQAEADAKAAEIKRRGRK